MRETRRPTLAQAVAPVVTMAVLLGAGYVGLGLPAEPMVIIATVVGGIIAVRLGHSYDGLMRAIADKIAKVMPAILILVTVGLMIGAWIAGGTIPMVVYFGLEIISPQYLYLAALVVTSIVAVATGTSWGAVGTIGVAFMGVALGMDGVNPAIVAGAVVSGAYFGDKLSPLSDTTNLTSAITQVDLYEHIRHLLYTTVPSWLVAAVVFTLTGLTVDAPSGDSGSQADAINAALSSGFTWNVLLLLPVAIVLFGSIRKLPTIPVMLAASFVAVVEAITIQRISLVDTMNSLVSGFSVEMITRPGFDMGVAEADVTTLLDRGGLQSMTGTLLIALCALAFAGVLSATGSLEVIVERLLRLARSTGSTIVTTIAVCLVTIATTCNGQISIVMPGEMLRGAYLRRGLHPKNLGRTIEDASTIIEPILPWTAAGAYMAATLGVATLEYAPWATLCWTGIVFATIWGFTGFGIARLTPEERDRLVRADDEEAAVAAAV